MKRYAIFTWGDEETELQMRPIVRTIEDTERPMYILDQDFTGVLKMPNVIYCDMVVGVVDGHANLDRVRSRSAGAARTRAARLRALEKERQAIEDRYREELALICVQEQAYAEVQA